MAFVPAGASARREEEAAAAAAARRPRSRGGLAMSAARHAAPAQARGGASTRTRSAGSCPFADMMTLLFALFMVLFAISSVNTSKFEALQKSLQEAFSRQGPLRRRGDHGDRRHEQPSAPSAEPPLPSR